MATRVLVSTTSFLDTPGPHREKLKETGYQIIPARGPLTEEQLIDIVSSQEQFDAFLCGEDHFTARVLEAVSPRAKVISKYGVGLERIDLERAEKLGIKVVNTPRVNHAAVAELTFGLLVAACRDIPEHNTLVHKARWERRTGVELSGKVLGVIGLGRVGKEVVKRALAFGMNVLVFNTNWSQAHSQFVSDLERVFGDPMWCETPPKIRRAASEEDILKQSDFISLHINLAKNNRGFLDRARIALCKRGVHIVNVSRGALVDELALADAIRRGHVSSYAADVLEPEPVSANCPLLGLPGVILTPHIASRTYESVARQGLSALQNIVDVISAA